MSEPNLLAVRWQHAAAQVWVEPGSLARPHAHTELWQQQMCGVVAPPLSRAAAQAGRDCAEHGPNRPVVSEAGLNPLGIPPASNVHVLLVDDERLTRTVVANLLHKCGYRGARFLPLAQPVHASNKLPRAFEARSLAAALWRPVT